MKKSLLSVLVLSATIALAQPVVTSTYFYDDFSGPITGATYISGGKFRSISRDGSLIAEYDSLVERNNTGQYVGQANLQNNVTIVLSSPIDFTDSLSRIVRFTVDSDESQKLYVSLWNGVNPWNIWDEGRVDGNVDLKVGTHTYQVYVPKGTRNVSSIAKVSFSLNMWGWNDVKKEPTPSLAPGGMLVFSSIEFGKAVTTALAINSSAKTISLHPNPASNDLHVSLPGSNDAYEIAIYNATGVQVISKNVSGMEVIDIASLPNGLYQVQCTYAGKKVSKSLVVSK